MARLDAWSPATPDRPKSTSGRDPFWTQTVLVFGIDLAANILDYGFHILLGRTLSAGDFAVFQSLNAVLIAVIAGLGALQPVVARRMVESGERTEAARRDFQLYFRWAAWSGLLVFGLISALRLPLAILLGLPKEAISVGAVVTALAFLRPAVGGALQADGKFLSLAGTKLAYSLGRWAFMLVSILAGWGLLAAMLTLPIGSALALAIGFGFLGRFVWRKTSLPFSGGALGYLKLSIGALLIMSTYHAFLAADLVWVNRTLAAETAGVYAAASLFRRMAMLFPGAVTVVVYPRLVWQVQQGMAPDRLIAVSASLIAGSLITLIVTFVIAGDWLVAITFAGRYPEAAGLLEWMGLGALGFSLVALWVNVFIGTQPGPFLALLVCGLVVQAVFFGRAPLELIDFLRIFTASGWAIALGGVLIYFFWLRPQIVRKSLAGIDG